MKSNIMKKFDLRMLTMIFILMIMWIFFWLKTGDFYFSGESIAKLSRDMATWTILAAGMTLIIVSGNIDLSVGSLLALSASACALMMNPEYGPGLPASVAVPVTLVICAAIGMMQGCLTAYFRIPAFIVTLAGLFIYRGVTQKLSAFDPRVPDASWVLALGFKYIPLRAGWVIGIGSCFLLAFFIFRGRIRKKGLGLPLDNLAISLLKLGTLSALILGFVYKVNQYKGIPNQTLIMIGVFVLLYIIARHMKFGRHLYAIGGNVEAARLSGIKVEKSIVGIFIVMGLLCGIAGIIWMAQNQGSTKNAGQFYELYAIASCVIGGTSLMGGRGTIMGAFLGGLVMATVIQGMDYTNLENWIQLVVRGSVLVIAVGIDIATKSPAPWMRQFRDFFCFFPKRH